MSRQHHVDQDDRQDHTEPHAGKRLGHHVAGTGEGGSDPFRQANSRFDLADILQRRPQRFGRFEVAHDGHLPHAILPVNLYGPRLFLDANQVAQFEILSLVGADRQAEDRFRSIAIDFRQSDTDIVSLAPLFKLRDLLTADQRPDRFAEIFHRYTEVGRPVAIDQDIDLRLSRVIGRVDVDDPGHLFHPGGDFFGNVNQHLQIVSSHVVLQRRCAESTSRDARYVFDADLQMVQFGQLISREHHDILLRQRPLTLRQQCA